MKLQTEKILLSCFIAMLTLVGTTLAETYEEAIEATPGLFAYWRFDGDTGADASTAIDELGNNNGTYAGAVPIAAGPNIGMSDNKAVDFSGIANYIDVGTLGSLGSTLFDGITIEMWVKSNYDGTGKTYDTAGSSRPFGLYHTSSASLLVCLDENFGDGDEDNRIRVGGKGVSKQWFGGVTSDTGVTDGTWNYLAITMDWDDDELAIYMGNEGDLATTSFSTTMQIDQEPQAVTNYVSSLFIGAAARNLSNGTPLFPYCYYEGMLDEMAIYQGQLTKEQIDSHLATASVPEPSTVALLFITMGMFGAWCRQRK